VIAMARAILLAATMAAVPTAAQASDKVGLSTDGVAWSATLNAPLFDPKFRWVPGDREESSFWVRNQSADGATLDVAVLGNAVDALMETGDLNVEVRVGNGPWHRTNHVGRQSLVSSMKIDPGQELKITVAVAFDPTSMSESEAKTVALRFDVQLTQALPGNDGRSDSDSDDSDDSDDRGHFGLPDTGGEPWWALVAGAAMVAAGAAVGSGTRRRERNG
jgi:LPXTG-motif cell wall-anchored protein